MASSPEDPLVAADNKSRRPKPIGPHHIDNTFDPRNVPRYIPPSTYGFSSNSGYSNTSGERGNYSLSTRNASTYRRGDPYATDEEKIPIGVQTTARATGRGIREPVPKTSVPSLQRGTTPPKQGTSHGNESVEETWEALVSLFACFETDPTPSVSPSSLLNSPPALKQQTAGNSAKPGHPQSSSAAQRKRANRRQRANNSGRGLHPDDDDDDHPWDKQGGSGSDDRRSDKGQEVSFHERFACPFHKSDPVRYASCHGASFKDIDSVVRVSYCSFQILRSAKSNSIIFVHSTTTKRTAMFHRTRWKKLVDYRGRGQNLNGRQFIRFSLAVTLSRSRLVSPQVLSYSPSDVSADWTPARHNRDIEENIRETLEVAMSSSQTVEQCWQEFMSLIQNDFDEEWRQAQRRRDMVLAEGGQNLIWMLNQKFPPANSQNTLLGDLSLDTRMLNQQFPLLNSENTILAGSALDAPHGEMLSMLTPNHVTGADGDTNFVPGECGKQPTSDLSCFQGVYGDALTAVTAHQSSPWDEQSSGNTHTFVGNGSQFPEPGQPGNSLMLSAGWTDSESYSTPDFDFSCAEPLRYQRGLPCSKWPSSVTPPSFVKNGLQYPGLFAQGASQPSNVNGSQYPGPFPQGVSRPSSSSMLPSRPPVLGRNPSTDSGYFDMSYLAIKEIGPL